MSEILDCHLNNRDLVTLDTEINQTKEEIEKESIEKRRQIQTNYLDWLASPQNLLAIDPIYQDSIPSYINLSQNEGGILDYENDMNYHGYHDDYPSFDVTIEPECHIKLTSCQQAFDLASGNHEIWKEILFLPNQRQVLHTEDIPIEYQIHHIQYLRWDCEDWKPCECPFHSSTSSSAGCLSMTFLALLFALPQLKGITIDHLTCNYMSLFANFPSPSAWSNATIERLDWIPKHWTISSQLEFIYWNHCYSISSVDLFYLGDCLIEHYIFPSLKHIYFHVCFGMSYSSIIHTYPLFDCQFDRFECRGRIWPQQPVNPKTFSFYCSKIS